MNTGSPWVVFWTVVMAAGLGAYYLVLLGVVPLGARDIRRMFTQLDAGNDEPESEDEGTEG